MSLASVAAELSLPPRFADALPLPLSLAQRQRSVSHEGGLSRLRCLLAKLRAGRNVTVAVLGGSVSAGSSSRVRTDQGGLYHRKLHRWLQRRFPGANVRHVNAAMPAVPPSYMSQCLALHVPPTTDLVLLEASANMCGANGAECARGRESVERMLRQVLRFRPGTPAVILVHAYPFWTMGTPKSWYMQYAPRRSGRGGGRGSKTMRAPPLSRAADLAFEYHRQWGHGANEDSLMVLGSYYDAPSVSLRSVIWHAMKVCALPYPSLALTLTQPQP